MYFLMGRDVSQCLALCCCSESLYSAETILESLNVAEMDVQSEIVKSTTKICKMLHHNTVRGVCMLVCLKKSVGEG